MSISQTETLHQLHQHTTSKRTEKPHTNEADPPLRVAPPTERSHPAPALSAGNQCTLNGGSIGDIPRHSS